MKPKGFGAGIRRLVVVICAVVIVPGEALADMPPLQTAQTPPAPKNQTVKIPPEQLDSLVAPIRLKSSSSSSG